MYPDQRRLRGAVRHWVAGCTAVIKRTPGFQIVQACRALLDQGRWDTRPYVGDSSSLFPQVAAGQAHEHIFQAGLARGQVQQLLAVFCHRIEKRGDGQVRLADVETDQAVVVANRFDPRKRPPGIDAAPSELPLTWNSTM